MILRHFSNWQNQILVIAALILVAGSAGLGIALNGGSLGLKRADDPYNQYAHLSGVVAAQMTASAYRPVAPETATTPEPPDAVSASVSAAAGTAFTIPSIPLLTITNQGESDLKWQMLGVYRGPAAYSRRLNVGVAGQGGGALALHLDSDPVLGERYSFVDLGVDWYPETIQPFDLLLINEADTGINSVEANALAAFHESGRTIVLALTAAGDRSAPVHALLNRIAGVASARPTTFAAAQTGNHPIVEEISPRTPVGPGVTLDASSAGSLLAAGNDDAYATAYENGARTVVMGGNLDDWYQVNPALVQKILAWGGVAWLFVEPQTGTVAANSQAEVTTALNTSGFLSGTHSAEIWIESNDPALPRVIVPITLQTRGEPLAVLDRHELDFGEVYVGYPRTRQFIVENRGASELTVDAIDTVENLIISPTQFTLLPLERQSINVVYDPEAAGDLEATLTIHSDSAISATQALAVGGTALQPPSIAVALIEALGATEIFTTANAHIEVGLPTIGTPVPPRAASVDVATDISEISAGDADASASVQATAEAETTSPDGATAAAAPVAGAGTEETETQTTDTEETDTEETDTEETDTEETDTEETDTEESTPGETTAAEGSAQPTPAPRDKRLLAIVAATEGAVLRAVPALEAPSTVALAAGTPLIAVGRTSDNIWLLVEAPGDDRSGWIESNQLRVSGEIGELPATAAE